MTDKETLILAAKAAGVVNDMATVENIMNYVEQFGWNPLESNEDCFRLETALGLNVRWHLKALIPHVDVDGSKEIISDHNGDKDKARRYASTRAGALIGEKA